MEKIEEKELVITDRERWWEREENVEKIEEKELVITDRERWWEREEKVEKIEEKELVIIDRKRWWEREENEKKNWGKRVSDTCKREKEEKMIRWDLWREKKRR